MGTNYYLKYENILKNRIDKSCLKALANLNQFTKVEVLEIKESDNFLNEIEKNNFDAIVQTEI